MFGGASDRAISIDPPPTDCRSATEPSLDWRNLLTTPGWRSRDSCQHAGEVKWFGAEEWFPSNRTADLARDGRNVVPGCLERQGSAVRPPAASPPTDCRAAGMALPSNSCAPRSRSSRAMALDMADWTMWASRAAA